MTTTTGTEADTMTGTETPSSEPCADLPLPARVEALLIGSDRPLTEARLGALLGIPVKGAPRAVQEAIEALNAEYDRSGRAFRAEHVAGGWQILTRADFAPLLAQLHTDRRFARLSPAAMETLAIIAYRSDRGGIMRAEIEAIRGVSCGEVLRGLLERRLVKVTGRADELGRPMLYGITSEFLKAFGLASLDDLPEVEGLAPPGSRTRSRPAPAPPDAVDEDAGPPEPDTAPDDD